MKIGIDCRMFSSKFTGIGRYTYELLQNFIKLNEKEGSPHNFVLFMNNPEYREFDAPKNVKKVLVNAKHYSFAEQTSFLLKLWKEKLDIVHFPHFNIPLLYRKPYIVTIHDLTLSIFPGQKMTKFYHRIAYNLVIKNAVKRAKKIIAVSENTKADIIKYLKVKDKKITVIYNGVSDNFKFLHDQTDINKTLKKYKITKQFFLYTGVWRNHKNLPRLIKAFHILKTKNHMELQLVITGKSDPHYPEVKNAVEKFRLEEDVIFPGMLNETELNHLYNGALTYVFPSFYEGFGLPPLEAMRCGTPVVASNSSSVPEICGIENAMFFDPYSAEDMVAKIMKLYTDPGLQAELIVRGLERSSKFSWETSAEKTYEIITESL